MVIPYEPELHSLAIASQQGRIQGEGAGGAPPPPEMTCGFLIQQVFCKKNKQTNKQTMWLIGVEIEQETSAPPPKKNPGSAPAQFYAFRPFTSSHRRDEEHSLRDEFF